MKKKNSKSNQTISITKEKVKKIRNSISVPKQCVCSNPNLERISDKKAICPDCGTVYTLKEESQTSSNLAMLDLKFYKWVITLLKPNKELKGSE